MTLTTKPERKVMCVLCRRKFVKPMAHKCAMGFLKRINKAARVRGRESIFVDLDAR